MEPWAAQLEQQTVIKAGSEYGNLAAKGYTMVQVAKTNLLATLASDLIQLTLPAGSTYILMGVCDNDCSDLDMALLQGGAELSKDTTKDDWPLIEVTPKGDAAYQMKVTMYDCKTPTCGYQLSVWKK